MNDVEKLVCILKTLWRWRWTTATLLSKLAQHRHMSEFRKPYNEFQAFAYRDVMSGPLRETISSQSWEYILDGQGWRRVAAVLGAELSTLVSRAPAFQKYSAEARPDRRSAIDSLPHLQPAIEEHAPTWVNLLNQVTGKPAQRRRGEASGLHVVIMSTLAHTAQPIKSLNFATLMGIYLYQGGARRRVMDVLARLGLCMTYKSIHRLLGDISGEQRKQVCKFGKDPATVTAYDNYSWPAGRADRRPARASLNSYSSIF